MGIVDQAVEDGVSQGGVADGGVPMFNRKLAGDDGRTAWFKSLIRYLVTCQYRNKYKIFFF